MYNLFGLVNEVDSQNKPRQPDLVLERFWVTQCGWIWLCTTVSMEMTITNGWKLFRYEVKRDHYEKMIGIRELSKRLAQDCFNNTFLTDTGTPSKNIPHLDEVDGGEMVSTCHALNFSSSISPSIEVSTLSDITLNSTTLVTFNIGSQHTAEKEEAI